ncbi:hypothetical protein BYT27DRAFT_7336692 [Phlegmacium glaucopus]|nr:hypothetical protein BYT27DRAFT_7336692 [Phlegmacium glaucopus]
MPSKEISREDLLILLASMGVAIPKTTKMPDEELNKRLTLAFDASQQFTNIIATTPVDVTSYPLWPSDKALYQATQRGNVSEALNQVMSQRRKGSLSPKEDTFKELRQSVLGFARLRDMGKREICFVDDDGRWGVFVQVLDVYNIKNDIPLFFIKYREIRPIEGQALSDLISLFKTEDDPIVVNMGDLERHAMLKLFRSNTRRLHSKYQEKNEEDKSVLQASFVLPLCPIGMRDLGSLTKDPGCEVCGKKNISRCGQCLAVSYCSRECQKGDWQNHKAACRSLKGGTWRTISVKEPPGSPPFRWLLNRLDPLHDASTAGKDMSTDGKPLANIQNGKIFLAKFQISLAPKPTDMMIYDRQRSFQVHWSRTSDIDLFDSARKVMGSKMKMYRWVRHISEDDFEVCLDRGPNIDPVW